MLAACQTSDGTGDSGGSTRSLLLELQGAGDTISLQSARSNNRHNPAIVCCLMDFSDPGGCLLPLVNVHGLHGSGSKV